MTQHEPLIWRLSEMSRSDGTEPTASDPQTGGKYWSMWTVVRNEEIDVIYSVVRQGTNTGAHCHPGNHYGCIVKGTALVWLDGTIVEVNQGDVLNIGPYVPHAFGSTQESDVWIVDLTNPPFDAEMMKFLPERDNEVDDAFKEAWAARS